MQWTTRRDKACARIAASSGVIHNEPGNLCSRETAWWGWEGQEPVNIG